MQEVFVGGQRAGYLCAPGEEPPFEGLYPYNAWVAYWTGAKPETHEPEGSCLGIVYFKHSDRAARGADYNHDAILAAAPEGAKWTFWGSPSGSGLAPMTLEAVRRRMEEIGPGGWLRREGA